MMRPTRLVKVASWFQTFKGARLLFQRFMRLEILKMNTMRREALNLLKQHHIPKYPYPQNSHNFMIYLENAITLPSPPSLPCSSRTKIPYSFFD